VHHARYVTMRLFVVCEGSLLSRTAVIVLVIEPSTSRISLNSFILITFVPKDAQESRPSVLTDVSFRISSHFSLSSSSSILSLSLSRDHKRTQFHTSRTRSRSLAFIPRHLPPQTFYEYSPFSPFLPFSLILINTLSRER